MSEQKTLRTASLIVLNDHKILLLLRDNREDLPSPNTWGLIGGFIEAGENEEEAARREAKEEAGINLGKLYHVGTHEYANGRISTTYLTIIGDEEAAKLKLGDEGQAVRFFSFEELDGTPLSGSVKRYYNNYRGQLRNMMETERPIPVELRSDTHSFLKSAT